MVHMRGNSMRTVMRICTTGPRSWPPSCLMRGFAPLEGQDHGPADDVLVPALIEFFLG